MSVYIDTHSHLYLPEFKDDIDIVVQKAIDAGVNYMLMPNVDQETIQPMLSLWEKYPNHCLPMMALHPCSVKPGFEKILEKMQYWFCRNCMIAVGETGIDLYWDKTHINEQIRSFERHIEWALEYHLPLVVHSRNSIKQIMKVLERYKGQGLTGVMHCFPGNVEEAKWFIDYGFMLGIGGVVTYKNSAMSEVVKQIDLRHLILETDAPYLTPMPNRGVKNEPSHIPLIAAKIATLKDTTTEIVAQQTTQNAIDLFSLELSGSHKSTHNYL